MCVIINVLRLLNPTSKGSSGVVPGDRETNLILGSALVKQYMTSRGGRVVSRVIWDPI